MRNQGQILLGAVLVFLGLMYIISNVFQHRYRRYLLANSPDITGYLADLAS